MTDLNKIIDSLKLIYDLLIDCVDETATLISISEEEKENGKEQFRLRENVPGMRLSISKKNGHITTTNQRYAQRYRCRRCGFQFTEEAQNETARIIKRLENKYDEARKAQAEFNKKNSPKIE